jgi:hypothetical protein
MFGWRPPFPSRPPLLRRWHYAEALADRIVAQALRGMPAAELGELVRLLQRAAALIRPPRRPDRPGTQPSDGRG